MYIEKINNLVFKELDIYFSRMTLASYLYSDKKKQQGSLE